MLWKFKGRCVMSGFNFIADTNVLIKLGQGSQQIASLLTNKDISISIITEMQILSWPLIKPCSIIQAAGTNTRSASLHQMRILQMPITPLMPQNILVWR